MPLSILKFFRELTQFDFRILSVIEVLMARHEMVPTEEIAAYLQYTEKKIQTALNRLRKFKLIMIAQRHYLGVALTFSGYDALALKALVEKGIIAQIGPEVGAGKESNIRMAVDDEGNQLYGPLQLWVNGEPYSNIFGGQYGNEFSIALRGDTWYTFGASAYHHVCTPYECFPSEIPEQGIRLRGDMENLGINLFFNAAGAGMGGPIGALAKNAGFFGYLGSQSVGMFYSWMYGETYEGGKSIIERPIEDITPDF